MPDGSIMPELLTEEKAIVFLRMDKEIVLKMGLIIRLCWSEVVGAMSGCWMNLFSKASDENKKKAVQVLDRLMGGVGNQNNYLLDCAIEFMVDSRTIGDILK
jgi:hypothetical protein